MSFSALTRKNNVLLGLGILILCRLYSAQIECNMRFLSPVVPEGLIWALITVRLLCHWRKTFPTFHRFGNNQFAFVYFSVFFTYATPEQRMIEKTSEIRWPDFTLIRSRWVILPFFMVDCDTGKISGWIEPEHPSILACCDDVLFYCKIDIYSTQTNHAMLATAVPSQPEAIKTCLKIALEKTSES